METIKKVLSNVWFIHLVVGLGIFALWGYVEGNKYLLLLAALSFSGAMCGAFNRVINAIKNKQ